MGVISGKVIETLEFLKRKYLSIREFGEYVRKRTKEWKDYVNAIRKPLRASKVSIVAHRHFIHWLFKEKQIDYRQLLEREELKVPKSRADRKVPSEEEVLETLRFLRKERPHDIYIVYEVLLETGLRLEHVIELLRNIDKLHIVKLNGYYRVDLNIWHGEKKALHAYLIHLPPKILIAANTVSNYISKHKLVNPKYIRKFVITKMHECNIDDSIVRFISGHLSEADIHDTRYYERLAKANKQYMKYAQWLKQNILEKVIGNE